MTYFMCSDRSKMEKKSLWKQFPLGKKSQQRFYLFITSGGGSIALSV